jgi:hypothetical protein
LETFATVVDGRDAVYVSSPLTTGRRALEWHTSNRESSPEAFRVSVIEPNRRAAARFASKLRKSTHRVVVDPTALPDLPGWTQDDYRDFWGRVIERFACEVVVRDGWQFSSGCSYEFYVATRAGLAVVAEDGHELDAGEGLSMLKEVLEERREQGQAVTFLEGVVKMLHTAGFGG